MWKCQHHKPTWFKPGGHKTNTRPKTKKVQEQYADVSWLVFSNWGDFIKASPAKVSTSPFKRPWSDTLSRVWKQMTEPKKYQMMAAGLSVWHEALRRVMLKENDRWRMARSKGGHGRRGTDTQNRGSGRNKWINSWGTKWKGRRRGGKGGRSHQRKIFIVWTHEMHTKAGGRFN